MNILALSPLSHRGKFKHIGLLTPLLQVLSTHETVETITRKWMKSQKMTFKDALLERCCHAGDMNNFTWVFFKFNPTLTSPP